jgi:hypothetical protein
MIALGLAVLSLILGIPVVLTYMKTGLVERQPTAILASALGVMSVVLLVVGIVLESAARAYRETRHLFYPLMVRWNLARLSFPIRPFLTPGLLVPTEPVKPVAIDHRVGAQRPRACFRPYTPLAVLRHFVHARTEEVRRDTGQKQSGLRVCPDVPHRREIQGGHHREIGS